MVRINLIDPKNLADQHLIAEYNEILMLLGHVEKYPIIKNQPKNYCLGPGHINFFKDKLIYLKNRHELIKEEMLKRGFKTNISINLENFDKSLRNNWKPKNEDFKIIKSRIREKIKGKSYYYRYYGKNKDFKFFNLLLEDS